MPRKAVTSWQRMRFIPGRDAGVGTVGVVAKMDLVETTLDDCGEAGAFRQPRPQRKSRGADNLGS